MTKSSELHPVFIREEMVKTIRSFFYEQNFHEVITPTLNTALPIEPNIYSFQTSWNTHTEKKPLYLSTSPEQGLKQMIAKGIGNCFAISKCFRNLEGAGSLHIPEYVMLEWYRENATYETITADLQQLILAVKKQIDIKMEREHSTKLTYQGTEIELAGQWPVYSLEKLFKDYAHLNLASILEDQVLFRVATKKGYSIENASWSDIFDQIFVNEILSKMPKTPLFIVDFPVRLSPLCKVQVDKPYLADRFEFFMFGIELANGNNENTDYKKVDEQFQKEKENREKKGIQTAPIDKKFINAVKEMALSGKDYAGIGLGVDRLAMIIADVPSITEVELLAPQI